MLSITKNKDGDKLTISLEGRLDTTTAPQLEGELKNALGGVTDLVMDMKELAYISSAGLRVVLLAHKLMLPSGGKMIIKSPSEFCKQVLSATGMDSILSVEN